MLAEVLTSSAQELEEKALHIASSTIEKLQEDLEKATFINLRFR